MGQQDEYFLENHVVTNSGVRCTLVPGVEDPRNSASYKNGSVSFPRRWIPYVHCEYWIPLFDTDDNIEARRKVQELEDYVWRVHHCQKRIVFDKWWCQVQQVHNQEPCACCYPVTTR